MIETLGKLNEFISNFDSIIGVLGLIIGVIGCVVGIIGKKELKEANNIKLKIKSLEQSVIKAHKIESNDSQFAQTIHNNGLGYKDTKEVASEVVREATKNKPNIYYGKDEPKNPKEGDLWIQ